MSENQKLDAALVAAHAALDEARARMTEALTATITSPAASMAENGESPHPHVDDLDAGTLIARAGYLAAVAPSSARFTDSAGRTWAMHVTAPDPMAWHVGTPFVTLEDAVEAAVRSVIGSELSDGGVRLIADRVAAAHAANAKRAQDDPAVAVTFGDQS